MDYIKKNLNVPNVLTLIRILLIPVYIVLFCKGLKYPALAVFVIACVTDLFDGLLARKLHQITDLGKLMDPFADKVMVLTAMFSMAIGNDAIAPVIPWIAVTLLLFKEGFMMLGGLLLLRKKHIVVYSYMIGKVAHCLFIGALVLTYFHDWFTANCVGWFLTPDLMLLWIAVLCAYCALGFYIFDSVRKIRAQKTEA